MDGMIRNGGGALGAHSFISFLYTSPSFLIVRLERGLIVVFARKASQTFILNGGKYFLSDNYLY